MNIVRIFESVIDTFNTDTQCGFDWSFTYARKDYANKKKGGSGVHVFLTKFRKRTIRDGDGFVSAIHWTFEANILLDSLFDIQIFNELKPSEAKSKFKEYVEPLLDCFEEAFEKEVRCLGLTMQGSSEIEADYNKFDTNRDGIMFKGTIRDE